MVKVEKHSALTQRQRYGILLKKVSFSVENIIDIDDVYTDNVDVYTDSIDVYTDIADVYSFIRRIVMFL